MSYLSSSIQLPSLSILAASIPLHGHSVSPNASKSHFYQLDNVICNGNEDLLSDCEHRGVGVHDCAEKHEEAGVICNSE